MVICGFCISHFRESRPSSELLGRAVMTVRYCYFHTSDHMLFASDEFAQETGSVSAVRALQMCAAVRSRLCRFTHCKPLPS